MKVYDPAAENEKARREGKKRIKRIKRPHPDRKNNGRVKVYNYCVDVLPSRYCLILISGGELSCVKFSPDDRMISIIQKYM